MLFNDYSLLPHPLFLLAVLGGNTEKNSSLKDYGRWQIWLEIFFFSYFGIPSVDLLFSQVNHQFFVVGNMEQKTFRREQNNIFFSCISMQRAFIGESYRGKHSPSALLATGNQSQRSWVPWQFWGGRRSQQLLPASVLAQRIRLLSATVPFRSY